MRVRLPALLALATATTYVACGASDPDKTAREGGAGGEGGEMENAAGTQSKGGTQNSAGSSNNPGGGAGGDQGDGGMLGGGTGGTETAGEGGIPNGGAGGEGPGPDENSFPPACGVVGTYTQLDGTVEPDTITNAQLSGGTGKIFARGLEGDDVFQFDNSGGDCLVGGPGDDELAAPAEYSSVLFGGSGADSFQLFSPTNNLPPTTIVDMSAEDTIGIRQAGFNFLAGQIGGSPYDTQLYMVADYEAGTGTIPTGEGPALVYDPATGGLWQDDDRGVKGSVVNDAKPVAIIANHASYTFDINDFELY